MRRKRNDKEQIYNNSYEEEQMRQDFQRWHFETVNKEREKKNRIVKNKDPGNLIFVRRVMGRKRLSINMYSENCEK